MRCRSTKIVRTVKSIFKSRSFDILFEQGLFVSSIIPKFQKSISTFVRLFEIFKIDIA